MKSSGKKLIRYLACFWAVSFALPSIANECYESSSFVENKDDIYIDHEIPQLNKKDFQNIQKILETSVGEWKGNKSVKECFGAKTSVTEKNENYEVKGVAEFDGHEFHFKMDLYSPTSKSRKTVELNYFLTEDNFSINSSKWGKAEVLDSTSSGVRYYRRFRQPRVGQPGTFVNETYYVLEAFGANVALKEYQYFNGELVLESITTLSKK